MVCGGGPYNYGNIFKIKPDGTSCDTIFTFNGVNGAVPSTNLITDGSFLYGTTDSAGTLGYGTIFKIKPDGTGYSPLFNFDSINSGCGANSLISDGTYLYGTTTNGGTNNNGTIFKIKHDGTGYSKLSDFSNWINGALPLGSLVLDGTFLYGMTYGGGTNNYGTIFKYQYCTSNCATGITENVLNPDVDIYPNPTSGLLNLQLGQLENIQIKGYNILGEKVYESLITNQQSQIDLSAQPNGIYFINLQTNESKIIKKIMLNH